MRIDMVAILNTLPDNYTQVSSVWDLVKINPNLNDFHKVLIGTKLLLKNSEGKYESYKLTEHTKEENIINYINRGTLYMEKND